MKPGRSLPVAKAIGVRIAIALALGAALAGIGMAGPAQAQTVIGQEYEHINWGGAVLTVTVGTSGFICTGPITDVDAWVSSMPGGWNDVISSYRTYAICWAKHWEHDNFTGASVGFAPTMSYVGDAMNDRTSSIQWS